MIRKLIDFCIRRPVTVTILIAVICVLGAISFSSLKIALYPDMEFPIAIVMTTYNGAGPEEVESNITKTVEEAVKSVTDIDTVFSYSMSGSSLVAVQFNWGTDLDQRMMDMRDKVDQIEGYLPDDAGTPTIMKMDLNSQAVINVVLSSDTLTLNQLQQIAEDNIQPMLERISDLSDVTISGGVEREIHVEVDPVKLQSYGLSLSSVTSSLAAENFNQSDGTVSQGNRKVYVRSMHEFETLDDIRNVAITTSSGIIHLSDIADISDTTEDTTQLVRLNGMNAVQLACKKASGANTAEACEQVKTTIEELISDLNLDINVHYVGDQSEQINTSINSTGHELLQGAIIAALIIFLFLKNIRSTLVICIAIPLSIISTFILMYFNNSTLNLITMGALSLGLGRMIDDSVVVYENIFRHKEMGKDSVTAAIDGASEVGGAVLATTTTISCCFLPIMFASGLAAVIFKPMALTMICAMLCSLVVSLTIVPLLASKLLKDNKKTTGIVAKIFGPHKHRGPIRVLLDAFGRFITWLSEHYGSALDVTLRHRLICVVIVLAALVGSFSLVSQIGMEFIPDSDSGEISVSIEADTGSDLDHTNEIVTKVEDLVGQVPEVETVSTSIGVGSYITSDSTDTATVSLELVDLADRTRSSKEVAEEIRNTLAKNVAGAKITVEVSSSTSIGSGSSADVEVDINGDDLDTLKELCDQVEDLVRSVPGTREITSNLSDGDPELALKVDRQKAATYGLSGYTIANEVKAALQGSTATKYRVDGDEYDIVVSYPQNDNKNIQYLQNLTLHGTTGMTVPLQQVATLTSEEGPQTIIRYDSVRRANVTCSIYNRDLGSVISDIQALTDEMALPNGYYIEFGGTNEYMTDSFKSLGYAMLLGLFLVYAVMAIQYESFFDPFIIMLSVPTSFIGALLALFLTGRSLSVTSMIGFIMLIGIVVANAILLVDYTKQLRERGEHIHKALVEAGRTRLRPIIMTALCTALAMLPMALALSEGAEMQAPMATVVIGGLVVSTVMTLFFVPVMYSLLDQVRTKVMGHSVYAKYEKAEEE